MKWLQSLLGVIMRTALRDDSNCVMVRALYQTKGIGAGRLEPSQLESLSVTQKKSEHFAIGTEGEDIATKYLRKQRYKIIDRNVRVGKHDEIDIVAFDRTERVIVFAEVKARAREDFDYRPELNITSEKRHRMSRAARRWIARKRYDGGYRLDVLCVAAGKIVDHFKEVAWA